MRFWSLLPWPGWNFKWTFGNTFCNNVGGEGSVSAWTIRGKDQDNYGVMCGFEVHPQHCELASSDFIKAVFLKICEAAAR